MKRFLKAFELSGGITLPNLIFPGPMEGVMSPLFCRTAEELHLIDFWMTPFLRITTGVTGKLKIDNFTSRYKSSGKPVIVQLMGTDPELIVRTAQRCKEMGFAGVNYNLACPSKQVLAKRSGGVLLKNHEFIKELMKNSLKLGKDFSVSLKIRSGFESSDETAKIAESISSGNPDFVVVHYRTVSEGYESVPGRDRRITEAVKYFEDIPVIANGDIDSSRDAEKIINETGCFGIMVARNWLKNPNLIRDIQSGKNTTEKEIKESFSLFIHTMAVNSHINPQKSDWNSIIDIASYIFDRYHPFFEYLINIPFKEPAKELSQEKILELI
jgi:tRNA-dihydrouridine synthase